MTTVVFIGGSMNIKHLDAKVIERIDTIVASQFDIVIGDAEGIDSSIQQYLCESRSARITIYCSGQKPRNNLGSWTIRNVESPHPEGTRAFYTVKDLAMAKDADFGLMVWDSKSTGTLSNIIELLKRNKKSVVFVNKDKVFVNVASVKNLEELVAYMAPGSRQKAEDKIRLSVQIEALKHEQKLMFA
jgi:hypothetical protein